MRLLLPAQLSALLYQYLRSRACQRRAVQLLGGIEADPPCWSPWPFERHHSSVLCHRTVPELQFGAYSEFAKQRGLISQSEEDGIKQASSSGLAACRRKVLCMYGLGRNQHSSIISKGSSCQQPVSSAGSCF